MASGLWKFKPDRSPVTSLLRPGAADWFRVFAVGMVGAFHIWQQSWIGWGKLDFLVRTGGAFVDGMILLSAFCLYLPYAHDWVAKKPFRGCKGFYRRRAVRILPGYYLATLIPALFAASRGVDKNFWLDVAGHLFLVPTALPQSYVHSQINGALWTVGVLVLFYLLFPLLSRCFYTKPLLSFCVLCAGQLGYTLWMLPKTDLAYSMGFNQLPAMLGVLALGFAAALLVAVWGQTKAGHKGFLLLGVAGILGAGAVLWQIAHGAEMQHAQLIWRMPLSTCFGAMLVGFSLAVLAPAHGFVRWLSAISYGFYLWHQWLAVQLKYHWRIPAWQGDTPPNQLGDRLWMEQYQWLTWAVCLGAAVVCYYAVERPFAGWIKSRKGQKLPGGACQGQKTVV